MIASTGSQLSADEPNGQVSLSSLIDQQSLKPVQTRVLLLAAAAITADGFDAQAMGFVAPAIVRELHIPLPTLGPIFAASLVGMLVGSITLGVLADRVGRRPVLIAAIFSFGVFTLATALSGSVRELIVARFLAGLGLGGVMGNAIALASEYSPARRRATILMALSCGFTGGAIAGGVLSAALVPHHGWRLLFLVGGLIPIIVALVMILTLPESLVFAATYKRWTRRSLATLSSIAPGIEPVRLRGSAVSQRTTVGELFAAERARPTLILWLVSFAVMLDLFFLSNWLPTLASVMGLSAKSSVILGTLVQLGGVVGALAMGPLIDRHGYRWVMTASFVLGSVAVAALGMADLRFGGLAALTFLAGFGVAGALPAVNTFAAALYPTRLRAGGVGWSLGVGRAGAIAGPLVAGKLLGLGWPESFLFLAAAIPAGLSGLLIAWLNPDRRIAASLGRSDRLSGR